MRILGVIFILLFSTYALTQQTGIIAGKITNKESGDPIPGANVTVQGTSAVGASSIKGKYKLEKVPPGTYTLISQMLGYTTTKVESVLVVADSTTSVDIQMEPAYSKEEKETQRSSRETN